MNYIQQINESTVEINSIDESHNSIEEAIVEPTKVKKSTITINKSSSNI